jgi:hypothetical protein
MSPDEPLPRRRSTQPLLDDMGRLIVEGKDATAFLWQVPTDEGTRTRLREVLEQVRDRSTKQGRREMPQLCDELLVALRAQPTPQQVDILQDGFDRLFKLWWAAKSGLL